MAINILFIKKKTHTNCGGEIDEIILYSKTAIEIRCKKCGEIWEKDY